VADMDASPFNDYIPFAIDYSVSALFKCIDFLHL
jgi:hypothetical protein